MVYEAWGIINIYVLKVNLNKRDQSISSNHTFFTEADFNLHIFLEGRLSWIILLFYDRLGFMFQVTYCRQVRKLMIE